MTTPASPGRERIESYVKHVIADEMRDYRIQFDIDGDPVTCFDSERAALFSAIAARIADQASKEVEECDRINSESLATIERLERKLSLQDDIVDGKMLQGRPWPEDDRR